MLETPLCIPTNLDIHQNPDFVAIFTRNRDHRPHRGLHLPEGHFCCWLESESSSIRGCLFFIIMPRTKQSLTLEVGSQGAKEACGTTS